jgi:16S rRNA (cytosine1402-N4)-methyltransferase
MTQESQEPPEPKPHKRRVRYSGRNPRRFEEKYKEHDPARYAHDVAHIVARGRTPAGMHLPICVKEVLSILDPKPGETGLDATLGFGGHARELIPRLLPGGRLFGLDVDPIELPRTEARLRGLGFTEHSFIAKRMNFAGILGLLPEAGGGFDFVLADLGVSSMQLDDPRRGFTYKFDGPLDLRLNPSRGAPASELLKSLSLKALTALLAGNADEPHAEAIAKAVKGSLSQITTTAQLAGAVRAALERLPSKETDNSIKRSLQRVFMALRIGVNEELSVLDRFLDALPWCLKPGGRVAILSFHSGEDRRVKKAFAKGGQSGVYSGVAPTCVRPSAEEQRKNSRSCCAKLRWAVRSTAPAQ